MCMQIIFFKVSCFPKQCTRIFKLSNALTNLWNKMMEGEAVVWKQNSMQGFEKNQHTCNVEGVFVVSDWTAHPYLKVAGLTWKIQSLPKQLKKQNCPLFKHFAQLGPNCPDCSSFCLLSDSGQGKGCHCIGVGLGVFCVSTYPRKGCARAE